MTLKTRKIIRTIFLLTFIIATPLAWIYAAGYKINFNKKGIQKTGMLILDSRPRGARIILNHQTETTAINKIWEKYILRNNNNGDITPAKIKNLAPGDYDVAIEMEGYWPWEKKLTVYPGASTFAEDIYLFRNSLPVQLIKGIPLSFSVSPNNNFIAANNDNKSSQTLSAIDMNKGEIAWSAETEKTPNSSAIEWSNDENSVWSSNYLFSPQDVYDSNQKVNVSKKPLILSPDRVEKLFWHPTRTNEILYLSSKKELNIFDTDKQASSPLLAGQKIINFAVNDKYLLVIRKDQTYHLDVHDLDTFQLVRSMDLPNNGSYDLINLNHQYTNVLDSSHNILYLFEPSASLYSPLRDTINNVKFAHWNQDDKMLYGNDNEIWLYDGNSKNKTLLTRLGTKIIDAFWHPSKNYIIYVTETTIDNIELDERNNRNTNQLVKLEKINNPFLNAKGDILYFSAEIGRQQGFYKMLLQ